MQELLRVVVLRSFSTASITACGSFLMVERFLGLPTSCCHSFKSVADGLDGVMTGFDRFNYLFFVKKSQKPSIINTASSVPAIIRSSLELSISSIVGLITNWLLMHAHSHGADRLYQRDIGDDERGRGAADRQRVCAAIRRHTTRRMRGFAPHRNTRLRTSVLRGGRSGGKLMSLFR